jgi:hypothetical protein
LYFQENPHLLLYAGLYQGANVCAILTSIIVMIIESSPDNWGRPIEQQLATTILDAVIMVFFMFDYLIRFFSSPNLLHFVLSPFNIIDLLVIIPYLIRLGLELGLGYLAESLAMLSVLKAFRLIRLFRFVRFASWSGITVALFLGIRRCLTTVVLLAVLFCISMIICATMVFFAEQTVSVFVPENQTWVYTSGDLIDTKTPFQSIYESFWWALITLTFLGEGTVAPQSSLGKVVTAATVLFGLFGWVFPVSIIVQSVVIEVNYYKQVRTTQQRLFFSHAQLLREIGEMMQELEDGALKVKQKQKLVGMLILKLNSILLASQKNMNDDVDKQHNDDAWLEQNRGADTSIPPVSESFD